MLPRKDSAEPCAACTFNPEDLRETEVSGVAPALVLIPSPPRAPRNARTATGTAGLTTRRRFLAPQAHVDTSAVLEAVADSGRCDSASSGNGSAAPTPLAAWAPAAGAAAASSSLPLGWQGPLQEDDDESLAAADSMCGATAASASGIVAVLPEAAPVDGVVLAAPAAATLRALPLMPSADEEEASVAQRRRTSYYSGTPAVHRSAGLLIDMPNKFSSGDLTKAMMPKHVAGIRGRVLVSRRQEGHVEEFRPHSRPSPRGTASDLRRFSTA